VQDQARPGTLPAPSRNRLIGRSRKIISELIKLISTEELFARAERKKSDPDSIKYDSQSIGSPHSPFLVRYYCVYPPVYI
jgi:hypothetical protein